MRILRTDYHVINGLGTVLYTSNLQELARKWARDNIETYQSLEVQEVTLLEQRRRVYRPRSKSAEERRVAA